MDKTDPLAGLPRLSAEALGPCIGCDRLMLEPSVLPLFLRLDVRRCGIDAKAVQRHVGLAMTMGGGRDGLALAGIMGPKVEPVVVMDSHPGVNVCQDCQTTLTVQDLHFRLTKSAAETVGGSERTQKAARTQAAQALSGPLRADELDREDPK